MLQLVYRKDGIANLEVITLVANNSDIAKVSGRVSHYCKQPY